MRLILCNVVTTQDGFFHRSLIVWLVETQLGEVIFLGMTRFDQIFPRKLIQKKHIRLKKQYCFKKYNFKINKNTL